MTFSDCDPSLGAGGTVAAAADKLSLRAPLAVLAQKFGRYPMKDHVYKIIELVGSSPESIDKAIENAIERANKSVRELRWFEVIQTRGHIEDGKVAHYQVVLKAGFSLES